MKIAVIGAGAMGSIYAGLMADAGNDVWAIDVWREHIDAIMESDRGYFDDMHQEWEDYVERHGGNPPEVPTPEDRHISMPAGWKPKR